MFVKGKYACDIASLKVGVNGFSMFIDNELGDGEYNWIVSDDEPNGSWKFKTCFQGSDIHIFDYDCSDGKPHKRSFSGSFMAYVSRNGGDIYIFQLSTDTNYWGKNIGE